MGRSGCDQTHLLKKLFFDSYVLLLLLHLVAARLKRTKEDSEQRLRAQAETAKKAVDAHMKKASQTLNKA